MSKFLYPPFRRDESVSEEIHGRKIADPYRWLEDPDSVETQVFVETQNNLTKPFLQEYPDRNTIKSRLTDLWNFPKFSCPIRSGDHYFFYKNDGLQNQSVLYIQDSLKSEPRVFFDPNTLSEDGTVSLSLKRFSENGKIFAYGLSRSGSDWVSIHFKDVDTGKDYPDVLEKVKFSSIAWTHDHKGIFYGCYPEQQGKTDGSETTSNEHHKLYYHRLGTSQSEDVLAVEFLEEPKWRIGAEVTDCGQYLIVSVKKDCKDDLIFFADLHSLPNNSIDGKLQLTQIVHKLEADYQYITNTGSVCVFCTNKDAPNYRLIQIDLKNPDPSNWNTLIPQHETDVLNWAACIAEDKLVVCYIKDVKNVLQLRELSTGHLLKTYDLDAGTIMDFSGKKKLTEFFYQFTSFLTPGIIFQCDLNGGVLSDPFVYKQIVLKGFDSTQFETEQIFYSSTDKVQIPMFIVRKKNFQRNGNNPCLMYGYGGFNTSIQPSFSVTRIVFIQHFDGMLAIPNIRGGGEYGDAWHNGGRLFNKQNVFNDFHCAAEYLISNRYTSSSRLAIQGFSNGGLLVGACINQRPELYGAAIAHVGVMDMLRFHKFTVGYCWCSDYGNPEEKNHFENLLKYSPVHNIKVPEDPDIQYPATLLLTADHDDRVVPLHSLKFIAELQHTVGSSAKQTNPLMIHVETKAGHGANKPTSKVIEEYADVFTFIAKTLNLKFHL